ncbi:hypothetical protein [Microvirga flavescens]|uniref:hypothetical protein n=1 Tax=Microvirga flavescens TaxID=2249811 RepID=UPI00130032E4|nr:hypothetical protein [Microvirga flavescens]
MTSDQWKRVQAECYFEAEKATAAADPRKDTTISWRGVYRSCAAIKGATFVGMTRISDEEWKPIWTACRQEVSEAIATRPASKEKEEVREDMEVECYKRRGIKFYDHLF